MFLTIFWSFFSRTLWLIACLNFAFRFRFNQRKLFALSSPHRRSKWVRSKHSKVYKNSSNKSNMSSTKHTHTHSHFANIVFQTRNVLKCKLGGTTQHQIELAGADNWSGNYAKSQPETECAVSRPSMCRKTVFYVLCFAMCDGVWLHISCEFGTFLFLGVGATCDRNSSKGCGEWMFVYVNSFDAMKRQWVAECLPLSAMWHNPRDMK